MLGLAPSPSRGIRGVGTIAQYRHLIQLGWPPTDRVFRLTSKTLFRLLSRDPDPALLFEYRKIVREVPLAEDWLRNQLREAATAALAEAGLNTDPRVRGSAHRSATDISQFLRSEASSSPLHKDGSQYRLDRDARPPTWYSLALMAAMPNLQRERAGFTERLGQYLAKPAPKHKFALKIGKKVFKTDHVLLGNPIVADGKGVAKDIPLALYFSELLARIGALHTSGVATRVLVRLLKDCDDTGVWHPHNLRSVPKEQTRLRSTTSRWRWMTRPVNTGRPTSPSAWRWSPS